MYTSGVRVLPDTSQLNQSADRLGQMKIALLQQDLADKQQQVAEFKTIVDNSYHNVWDQDREEYTRLQDDFLKKASDIYKKKDGRPTMADYQQIKKEEKNLEHFVASHNQLRAMASDVVAKAQFNDKIDFKPSLKQFNDIMEGEGSPHEKLAAIQSGGWIVPAKVEVDFSKIAKGITEGVTVPTGGYAPDPNVPDGGGVITKGTKVDLKKAKELAELEWASNPNHQYSYTKPQFVGNVLARIKPGYSTVDKVVKGSTTNTGLNPWGLGKGVPLVLKKDAYDRYNLETNARGKPLPKITIDEKMKTYDDNGNPIDVKASLNGTIVGFEQKEFEGNNELYARVKIPTGKDKNVFVLSEPSKADDDVSARKPKQDNRIVYYPVNKLSSDFFETHMIQLDGLNEFSGDDEYEQYFR
jgi:hypothetical protein